MTSSRALVNSGRICKQCIKNLLHSDSVQSSSHNQQPLFRQTAVPSSPTAQSLFHNSTVFLSPDSSAVFSYSSIFIPQLNSLLFFGQHRSLLLQPSISQTSTHPHRQSCSSSTSPSSFLLQSEPSPLLLLVATPSQSVAPATISKVDLPVRL